MGGWSWRPASRAEGDSPGGPTASFQQAPWASTTLKDDGSSMREDEVRVRPVLQAGTIRVAGEDDGGRQSLMQQRTGRKDKSSASPFSGPLINKRTTVSRSLGQHRTAAPASMATTSHKEEEARWEEGAGDRQSRPLGSRRGAQLPPSTSRHGRGQ